MDLAVLPDGRVLHTERSGEVWLHDPDTGLNTLAAKLDVYQHDEEGLQSIALDPNFEEQQLGLPLLLAAAEHAGRRPGDAGSTRATRRRLRHRRPTSRRSRALSALALQVDQASDSTSAPSRRSSTCRSTAASAATSAATSSSTATATCTCRPGDDTNPFESDGYAPIDERAEPQPGVRRPAHVGQHQRPARQDPAHQASSAGGGYTIPAGNLFRPGTALTRPRSTRWASATRSGSRSTSDTDVYVGDYSPGRPQRRTRRAARPGRAAG